ncbi:hypothetical protein V5799_020361 [Amblyomma americanum]|uniref:Hemolymph juvenile hormone binding protein n=1 Tax=Amblyomma americanum TaxID=6943 RepID=A0AAQ4EUN9_AMBAM
MSLGKCFLLIIFLPASICENCSEQNTLFDRGLTKVLQSDRFSEMTLPDFSHNVGHSLGIRVGFFDGKLHGLRTIRKTGQSVLNVDDSGSRLTFHITAGPIVARYSVGIRTPFSRKNCHLGVEVNRLHGSFSVLESSPNELQLEVHGIRMSRIRLLLGASDQLNLGGPIYDALIGRLRPLIQRIIGQVLVQELRKLAEETIGAVQVYAATSILPTVRERESAATPLWRKATGSARSYMALTGGRDAGNTYGRGRPYRGGLAHRRPERRRLEPLGTGQEDQRDVFDGCLRKLVVSTGFEPTQLPDDLEEFSVASGSLRVVEGNVTGLSSIRKSGHSWATIDDCGIRARFRLGFKELMVTAKASFTVFYVTTDIMVDVQIPEVEAVLEIKENNTGLQIVAYELNFTAPVTVKAKPLGKFVGTFVNLIGGLSDMTLGAEELKQFEVSSSKYVQSIARTIQEIIADPPLLSTP